MCLHVVRGEDAASSFVSHQNGTERADTTTAIILHEEYVRYVVCSAILQVRDKLRLACFMAHLGDPRRMWELPHQRYSVKTTFSKAALH